MRLGWETTTRKWMTIGGEPFFTHQQIYKAGFVLYAFMIFQRHQSTFFCRIPTPNDVHGDDTPKMDATVMNQPSVRNL